MIKEQHISIAEKSYEFLQNCWDVTKEHVLKPLGRFALNTTEIILPAAITGGLAYLFSGDPISSSGIAAAYCGGSLISKVAMQPDMSEKEKEDYPDTAFYGRLLFFDPAFSASFAQVSTKDNPDMFFDFNLFGSLLAALTLSNMLKRGIIRPLTNKGLERLAPKPS